MKRGKIKIVCVGDFGVGKTTLIRQFSGAHDGMELSPTIQGEYHQKEILIDGETYSVNIWDTAGMEKLRGITSSFYRGADSVMLIYDISNLESFENCESWLKDIQRYTLERRDSRITNDSEMDMTVTMLVGNKADLEDDRQVETSTAQAWADENMGMLFGEVSAKTGFCVDDMFSIVTEAVVSKRKDKIAQEEAEREELRNQTVEITPPTKEKKGRRCIIY